MSTTRGSRGMPRKRRALKRSARSSNQRRSALREQRRGERARAHLTRMRQHRDLSAPKLKLVLSLLFALALVAGILTGSSWQAQMETGLRDAGGVLEAIAVQGSRRLPASEVARATGIARNAPANSLDVEAIEGRLLEHPWIADARALQLPNGELIVSIDERRPAAALHTSGAEKDDPVWRLVDATGTPFANAAPGEEKGLPRIVSRRVPPNDVADPQLARAVTLARSIAPGGEREAVNSNASARLQLPAVGSKEGWVLQTSSPVRRVILGDRDLDQRLERLAMLLEADLDATRQAREIDLRFAGRAVLRSASVSR